MSNNDKKYSQDEREEKEIAMEESVERETPEVQEETVEETEETSSPEEKIAALEEELAKEKKEYMFLMAEFDNFRKRTIKEKSEIIRNAGENVFKGLLPIMDDFERGLEANSKTDNSETVKEGMELIYQKLRKYLEQNGVKELNPDSNEFDTEKHEAISVVNVPDESQKGKIIDTVEKGYMINDKVLRHAKVVVGQ